MKLTRWLLPIFAVGVVFLMATPVLAIDDPDSMSVNAVYAYRNCRETGDQLYLVDYTISYNVTGNPDEDAGQAFLCRLLEGSTELRAVSPFPYHDDGYGRGVAAIYFSAADAPGWEAAYTMELVGNPFLDWSGTPPSDTESTFDLWQDNDIAITHVVLSSRIINLAEELETAWSVDMVQQDTQTGEYTLTIYGAAYFSGVVPYLTDVAPSVFVSDEIQTGVTEIEIDDVDMSTEYADELETGIIGTLFDMTPLADEFGVGRGVLTALLYYGIVLFALITLSIRMKSQKPLMLLSIPLVILGAFVGVPLVTTILAGFISLAYIAYTMFYKPSSA